MEKRNTVSNLRLGISTFKSCILYDIIFCACAGCTLIYSVIIAYVRALDGNNKKEK